MSFGETMRAHVSLADAFYHSRSAVFSAEAGKIEVTFIRMRMCCVNVCTCVLCVCVYVCTYVCVHVYIVMLEYSSCCSN